MAKTIGFECVFTDLYRQCKIRIFYTEELLFDVDLAKTIFYVMFLVFMVWKKSAEVYC